tara:strand:+ start:399 stop:683 length:285 start_codon:yes stop_codon:yes gene_type:complete
MKITKAKLKQIIKEELTSLSEGGIAGHLVKSDDSMVFDQKTASSMLYHLENLMDELSDIEGKRSLTPEETEKFEKLKAQYSRIMNAGLDAGYGA